MTPNEDYVLTMPGAIDKFIVAGQVANESMKEILALCVPSAKVSEIIKQGNQLILNKLAKVYTNKKLDKGFSFPLSININQVCSYFSPL
jgi:methionine aminopeptidase